MLAHLDLREDLAGQRAPPLLQVHGPRGLPLALLDVPLRRGRVGARQRRHLARVRVRGRVRGRGRGRVG